MKTTIRLGQWSEEGLDKFIGDVSRITVIGEKIAVLSETFLGTPYKESTLIGDACREEVLVVDLAGVDCFTFIDYVEAMRLSNSFSSFVENLGRIRYRLGRVAFDGRNHFFTDWLLFNAATIYQATASVGGNSVRQAKKILNVRSDGTLFLPGIPPEQREVAYIPREALGGETVLEGLQTGDYLGIYAETSGLDVSHVGIVIKTEGRLLFRNASSLSGVRAVIDQDLRGCLSGKPGMLVLRPLPRK